MNKKFKVFTALLLTLTMCFSLLTVTASAAQQKIKITKNDQVVDTFNGVSAKYKKGLGNTNTGDYSCAGYVKKYYSTIYKTTVTNLLTGKTPSASKGSFSKTSSPQPGDIGYQLNSGNAGHWFIIKSVSGGTFTIIEQNWKWGSNGATYCYKDRQVTKNTKGFKAFRWSGKTSASNPGSLDLNHKSYLTWNKHVPMTTYTRETSADVKTYSDRTLKTYSGKIFAGDKCTITEYYSDTNSCKVKYPVKGGTKTAYASLYDFFPYCTLVPVKLKSNTNVYAKSNLKTKIGTSYTSDSVYISGTTISGKGSVKIVYNVSGGYKAGYISTSQIK